VSGELTDDWALLPVESPVLKHARIEWEPTPRVDVARVAVRLSPLPLSVVVDPRIVPPLHPLFAPSLNSTELPDGKLHDEPHVIVAVNVTESPELEGFRLDVTVVVVLTASVKEAIATPELAPSAMTT
jgi:hypothetical protein